MSSTTRTTRKVAGGAVGFLVVMEFGSGLLQGWFPPLLSRIGSDFGVEAAALNWVMVIYLLMTVAFVPIIGKLGDLYGHKKMLLITVCLVAAGSLLVLLLRASPGCWLAARCRPRWAPSSRWNSRLCAAATRSRPGAASASSWAL
ncbi:MFS transporter [Arthrobacter sp. AG1021]|nr:MFS transporter [Arthrobacter sp. AG1021]